VAEFLALVGDQWRGILILLACLLVLTFVIKKLCWVFAWGRFKALPAAGGRDTLSFVFADLLVKIINDFRHLLALIVVMIFAAALINVLVLAWNRTESLDVLSTGLQAVVSAFGGLIGAIIGYYFGERAAEQQAAGPELTPTVSPGTPVQGLPAPGPANGIERAPPPPVLPEP
jgi:hypothetical protein